MTDPCHVPHSDGVLERAFEPVETGTCAQALALLHRGMADCTVLALLSS